MYIKDYMSLISKYRAPIMGLCITEVLIGHSEIVLPGAMNYFLKLIWVIDIFFFFTGLGVFHSMKKDEQILPFYQRRFMRIYPYYLPVVVIYFIGQIVAFHADMTVFDGIKQFVGNVLMVGWINSLDRQFNWYPQAVALAYLVAPILYLAVRRSNASPVRLLALLGFFIVSQLSFLGTNILVGYSRAIPFVLGIIAADLADRGVNFKLSIPLMLAIWVGGNVLDYWVQGLPMEISWTYGLSWYPGLLVIPGMMLIFCWFFRLCDRVSWLKWITRLFTVLGTYSFEIFIMQRLIYGFIDDFKLPVRSIPVWLVVAAFIALIAIGYSLLVKKVLKGFKKKTA